MTPIEQAREALKPFAEASRAMMLTGGRNPKISGPELASHLDRARVAFDALTPSTPVDGVGAEPVAWRVRVKSDDPEEWSLLPAGGGADYLNRKGYECQPLYAAPLANPEAEARLRERVDVKQIIADVEAGKRDVFLNKGEYPHGNGSDLDCPYCGGSGHKHDAEARLAQAEGGPAVTEAAGVRLAIKFIEKRHQDYIEEHGSYDPSTGVTEFPDDGEYAGELEEIIQGLQGIEASLHTQSTAREEEKP